MIDAAPFIAWLDKPGRISDVTQRTGRADDSWLRKGAFRHTGLIDQVTAEDILHPFGLRIRDLYDETVVRLPSGRRKPSHAGIPITVGEDVLIEAHRLHIDEGYSLRKLGRVLHRRTTAKNPESLARILHNAFQQRGWETVSHHDSLTAFNRGKVDHLPYCTHIHQIGARKGQRCARRTSHGTCWHHDPQRLRELEQRLRPTERAA